MTQTRIGTVTLLFTDLERSTELLRRLGDDEANLLRRAHFQHLRDAVAARGGEELKNLGDGLMVVFASALDALACAVAMQQAVHRHNQLNDAPRQLHVRVGLEIGEPIPDENDYFGMPVVVAKRLCDSAKGGQIVVSDLVRRLIGSRGGYTFVGPEPLSLKNIAEPLLAYEVAWEPQQEEPEDRSPLPAVLTVGEQTAFVGRERELAILRRHWERARNGNLQLALLAGEPGIGKTRLAAELAQVAHGEGATILFGRCDEGTTLEYQPFIDALSNYANSCPPGELRSVLGGAGAELARLLPELVERLPDLSPRAGGPVEIRQHRLDDAFVTFLTQTARSRPTVLVLDDLHWSDQPTLHLLRHIMRSLGRSPLLVIGTYRETELPRTHPLSQTLADVRRHKAFERISLEGLGEGDVGALLDAWENVQAPPEFAHFIHEQTEGNPFFIEEVLRHLSETDITSQVIGSPDSELRVARLRIPESLKDVIGQRLSRLSQACNSILTIASVIGREFAIDALERASNVPADQLLKLLDEALDAHVVTEVPHMVGHYSFSHTLIHETLYEELTTTRRVHLHGQTLQYADSGGVKLAYEVLGSAGPYLTGVGLTNCPATRSRNWTTVRRWDRITRSCRLILYDRRGVGFSAAPKDGYDLDASIGDLLAILDCVGVGRTVLWGATDGGPLAIAFAAKYPERVSGLILAGTTPKLSSWGDFTWGINPAIVESFVRLDAIDQGRAAAHITRSRHDRLEESDAIGELIRRVPRAAWSQILDSLAAADVRPLLAQVRAPTLILHDPDNQYIPVEAAHYMHEHLPNSELEVTEEYGSLLLGDTLYRKIETFIEETTARSPP